MKLLLIFFFSHWFLSLFFHTFFLHRYSSHQMYKMNPTWEKIFYFCTFFFMGSSFLVPRAYAVMHRMHHAYSDTEADPHSPHFFKDVMGMMKHTSKIYGDLVAKRTFPMSEFAANLPTWDKIDEIGDNKVTRIAFGTVYTLFYLYVIFVLKTASPFFLLLLPIHYLMGPVQGAAVNWCGHKYGYRNYDSPDKSKNTEFWGILLLGELFQNNHHENPMSANFAKKWWEIDMAYPFIRGMNMIGILKNFNK
jgi:stearoyl-CoA desaturase (Delta-9 desaturase)